MLNQQINLYRSFNIAPPDVKFLSLKRYLYSQALMVVILSIVYIYSAISVSRLEKHNEQLQHELEQLKNDFRTKKSTLPSIFFSKNIEETVSELQKQIMMQTKLLQSLEIPTPFYVDLTAIAHAITPNTWLTKIEIENFPTRITLRGKSFSMSSIQQFMTNLAQQNNFKSYVINLDNIQVVSDNKNEEHTNFELSLVNPKQ